MPLDEAVIQILRTAETIAIVGCSPKPYRQSNSTARYLMDQGFRVLPINPKHDFILNLTTYRDLREAREAAGAIEIVNIFRAPESVGPHVDEAVQVAARLVWMQLGVIDEQAARRARTAGLEVVMDECLKVRYGQLKRLGVL